MVTDHRNKQTKNLAIGLLSSLSISLILLTAYAIIKKNRAEFQYKDLVAKNNLETKQYKNTLLKKENEIQHYKNTIGNIEVFHPQTAMAFKEANISNTKPIQAISNRLALEAELTLPKDAAKALRIAEAAYKIDLPPPSIFAIRALCSTAYSNSEDSSLTASLIHDTAGQTAEFSPDGSRLLTASGNTAKLWDTQGNLLADLKGHMGHINSAIFSLSPKNSRILTASEDNTAKLWDLNGNLLANFTGHTERVVNAIFSPDGSRVLTASEDHTAKLWDIKGNCLLDIRYQAKNENGTKNEKNKDLDIADISLDELLNVRIASKIPPVAIALSPDSSRILIASEESGMKLWDSNGKLLADVKGHTGPVNSAAFSPDGSRILTASKDQTAKLWDAKGNLQVDLKGHTDAVNGAVFSPDGRLVLTASDDKTAKLWDLNGNLLADLKGHTGPINSAVFSLNGSRILTASGDKTAKLWNIQGNLLANLKEHTDAVGSAAFSPDGKRIVTASVDGRAVIWLTPEGIIEWLKTAPIPKLTKKEKIELGIE